MAKLSLYENNALAEYCQGAGKNFPVILFMIRSLNFLKLPASCIVVQFLQDAHGGKWPKSVYNEIMFWQNIAKPIYWQIFADNIIRDS